MLRGVSSPEDEWMAAFSTQNWHLKLAELSRVRVADLVGDDPEAEDQPAEVVAMFRDLKALDLGDRETIRMLMETMKKRRKQKD